MDGLALECLARGLCWSLCRTPLIGGIFTSFSLLCWPWFVLPRRAVLLCARGWGETRALVAFLWRSTVLALIRLAAFWDYFCVQRVA